MSRLSLLEPAYTDQTPAKAMGRERPYGAAACEVSAPFSSPPDGIAVREQQRALQSRFIPASLAEAFSNLASYLWTLVAGPEGTLIERAECTGVFSMCNAAPAC